MLNQMNDNETTYDRFRAHVLDRAFPCLGAKSALRRDHAHSVELGRLGNPGNTLPLADALEAYIDVLDARVNPPEAFHTFVAHYEPQEMDELAFEQGLWSELQSLHEYDAQHHPWAPHVSSDPQDPSFAYSFAQVAFFVVGLHPASSRLARQFERPTLVFNFHDQFERLRQASHWERMQGAIRARDVALQGFPNPELADHGAASQVRQYSGRLHQPGWRAPFERVPSHDHTSDNARPPSGCPFSSTHGAELSRSHS